ncbi:ABC transporter substrate-binding protein [Roseomonas sp. WA12]
MIPRLHRRRLPLLALTLLLTAPDPARAVELRIGMGAVPTTMDPHFQADSANTGLQRHVFETLLQWSPDGRLQPLLARSWALLPEGNGWELEMDPAARFSDGTPVTAADAAASLHRAMTIPNSPGRYTPFLSGLERVEIVHPGLLRLHSVGPAPLLPNGLTTILVVPARIAQTASPAEFDSGAASIGSGPFRLRAYRAGERAEFDRHPGWWGAAQRPPPAWDRVSLRIMTQDSARVVALLAGELDLIDAVPPRDAVRMARQPALRLARQPGTRVMYLALNHAPEATPGRPNPLRDPRIRQALSLALDRQALVSQVMEGEAVPTAQITPSGRPTADPDLQPAPVDRAAARRLLEEAGMGTGLRLGLIGTTNRFVNDEQLLQAVAQMWRQVGIETEVEAMPSAAFFRRHNAGRFTAALSGWLLGPGEPNSFFTALLATRDAARGRGSMNGTGYAAPRLDATIDEALATLDPDRRHGLWREAARQALSEDVALLPLFHQTSVWAMRQGVTYTPRADGLTLAQDARQTDAP